MHASDTAFTMSHDARPFLQDLPDELLDYILSFLPLNAFLSCQLTCRRISGLTAQSLQWRRHCLAEYKYWRKNRGINDITNAAPASIEWKKLFHERKQVDNQVLETLDSLISSATNRITKTEKILELGYDARDILTKQLRADESQHDVLARRYWTAEVIGAIERSIALEEWDKLTSPSSEVTLEKALGAFDNIIIQNPPESLDQIGAHLDMLADQFKQRHPEHLTMSAREKALAVAEFLLSKRITSGNLENGGPLSEQIFRQLQNALISVVLCDDNHPSIPIVSVAIFCCVAERVGLIAAPCAFPARVLAMVTIPTPTQHELESESDDVTAELLFMDVWGRVKELSGHELRQQLSMTWGYPQDRLDLILSPAKPREIMERNMRNIQETLNMSHEHTNILSTPSIDALKLQNPFASESELDHTSLRTTLNPDRAIYAIAWSTFFVCRDNNHNDDAIRVSLAHLAAALRDDFRLDIALFEKYLQPAFQTEAARSFGQALIQEVRDDDATAPTSKRRSNAAASRVTYRVGQVFRHRRYGYTAAITGWDTRCQAGEHWVRHMRVDALPGGREQCFYHALVDDESTRYVAEENIDLITPDTEPGSASSSGQKLVDPPEGLMRLAGKYFKRWDAENAAFVSNLKDEYPDD